ncbi:MAG: carbohydrate kinase [Treponema sp.]|nr:carbohydrate kinase [Treponema sp.]
MTQQKQALAFGEVLWDILPEKKCLGGAPLNCGGHLNRLGFETSMISAVGSDLLGTQALDIIKKEQISTQYIQSLPAVETGFTQVTLENGIPSYEFNTPCAWDCITLNDDQLESIKNTHWSVFCFGTLAQRNEVSRQTLSSIFSILEADIVFFDINLRKNFYSTDIIKNSLIFADILKLNDEEVPILSKLLEYDGSPEAFIEKLIKQFSLEGVIVTLGKKGAAAYFDGTRYEQKPSAVKVVDTVGAGDSFSAAFLATLANGHSVQDALQAGTIMADYVVSHDGALPAYNERLIKSLAPYIHNCQHGH